MDSRAANVRQLMTTVEKLVERARRGMSKSYDLNRHAVLRCAAQQSDDQEPAPRPIDVAQLLGMYPSSVTRHVRALAEDGLLRTVDDPGDQRSRRLEVTSAGREHLRRHAELGADVFAGVIADWSEEEIVELAESLERLLRDWERHGQAQRTRARRARRPTLPSWVHDPDA